MNTSDQQPDPDDEQTIAHHERADEAEGVWSSAEASGRVRPHGRRLQPTAEARNFTEQVLDLMTRYERDQAARRAAEGDTNPYDLDPYSDVHDLAHAWEETRDDPGARARFLDALAEDIELADLRALRLAGEAAREVTPRVSLAAADKGMKAPRIADMLGVTPAYVYGILREARQERMKATVEYTVNKDVETGGDPRKALHSLSAVREQVPEEHRDDFDEMLETLRAAVAKHGRQDAGDE